jgi:hypothetical protein
LKQNHCSANGPPSPSGWRSLQHTYCHDHHCNPNMTLSRHNVTILSLKYNHSLCVALCMPTAEQTRRVLSAELGPAGHLDFARTLQPHARVSKHQLPFDLICPVAKQIGIPIYIFLSDRNSYLISSSRICCLRIQPCCWMSFAFLDRFV